MVKSGKIDSFEEFMKVLPDDIHLLKKHIELKKRYQELKNNSRFDFLSSEIKIEMRRSMLLLKSTKSNLLHGKVPKINYECSLRRFTKSLLKAEKSIDSFFSLSKSVDIDKLEKILLDLPGTSLKELLFKVINKTGIDFSNENEEKIKNSDFIQVRKEMELKFEEVKKTLPPEERRKALGLFYTLRKLKASEGNEQRARENFQKRIDRLKAILF